MDSQGDFSIFRDLFTLLRRVKTRPITIIVPVVLSMMAAALEGVSISLLIPMLQGFFSQDFSFLKSLPVLGDFINMLPLAVTTRDRTLFAVLLAIFVVAVVLKNVLRYLSNIALLHASQRTNHEVRKAVFARYLSFGKLFFDRSSIGYHQTVIATYVPASLEPVFLMDRYMNALFSLVAFFVIMCMISWKLTVFALPLFVLLHFSVQLIIGRLRKISNAIALQAAEMNKKTIEILSSVPLVKAYDTEAEENRLFDRISDKSARLIFHSGVLSQFMPSFQEIITLFCVLLLFAAMLYLLVQEKSTAPPAFVVYFYLVSNAANKFSAVTGLRNVYAAAAGPLKELMNVFRDNGKEIIPDGTETFPGLHKQIAFHKLNFSYTSEREILKDLSFTIEKGKMTAIVGPTGAGKTTVISLLMRLYDCQPGSLLVDGKDIRDFRMATVRARMALVSQETFLLHDTLRNNIAYGLADASEGDLWEAVSRARLESFVQQLPDGLNTLIGDRGVKLSGGEKQRVSIARALLKKADILILDEATSSLDSRTERLIQEAIDDVVKDKTSIVIAHRLSTIKHADKIVVLENGKCVEQGSLEQLLGQKGTFNVLWEEQKFT